MNAGRFDLTRRTGGVPSLDPGAFDRRISILRQVQELDDVGKPVVSDAEPATCDLWAKYVPVSDRERLTHKEQTELTARFTVRWSKTASLINTSDKLAFEGRQYGIVGVKELGRRRYIEITAGAHET